MIEATAGYFEICWPFYDNAYQFCICPHCGAVSFQFEGRADRIPCACPKSAHGDKGYTPDHPRIVAALYAARSARFEYGDAT
jgi:hypothetical protein